MTPRDKAGRQAAALMAEDDLTRRAGGMKDVDWVATYLGAGTKDVTEMADRKEVLMVAQGERSLFPAFQFRDGEVVPGLRDILQVLPLTEGWSRLSFLLAPDPALDGKTPIQAFMGDRETVLALAAEVDSQGAP